MPMATMLSFALERQASRHAGRQAGRRAGRQAGTLASKQVNRQRNYTTLPTNVHFVMLGIAPACVDIAWLICH